MNTLSTDASSTEPSTADTPTTEGSPIETPAAEASAAEPAAPDAPEAETPVAEAPVAAKPAKPAAPKAPRANSFGAERAKLLTRLWADYDFKFDEGGESGALTVDFWTLAPELKKEPVEPEPNAKPQDKWPVRGETIAKRDFRLYIHFSKLAEPSWGVPSKDIDTICKDRSAGLLLLLKDQKGYFLPSGRLAELRELSTPSQDGTFKISGPKLRKAAIARFFSLNGFAGELAAAIRNSR